MTWADDASRGSGTVVDNLVKLSLTPVSWLDGSQLEKPTAEEAFEIALFGAENLSSADHEKAKGLVEKVKGLDDESITCACMLSVYDACGRAGRVAFTSLERMVPDSDTIENIRLMVNRTTRFFAENGPVTKIAPTFEGAYTDLVTDGEADIMTNDAIWDIKVLSKAPKTQHTLQVYMYYLMGKRANALEFLSPEYIGIFNPRLHVAYRLNAEKMPASMKDWVERDVIGYDGPGWQDLIVPLSRDAFSQRK